ERVVEGERLFEELRAGLEVLVSCRPTRAEPERDLRARPHRERVEERALRLLERNGAIGGDEQSFVDGSRVPIEGLRAVGLREQPFDRSRIEALRDARRAK